MSKNISIADDKIFIDPEVKDIENLSRLIVGYPALNYIYFKRVLKIERPGG